MQLVHFKMRIRSLKKIRLIFPPQISLSLYKSRPDWVPILQDANASVCIMNWFHLIYFQKESIGLQCDLNGPPNSKQTRCSRGCSKNTSVTDLLIDWLIKSYFSSKFSKQQKSQTVRARDLKFWHNDHYQSNVMCHMSSVMCHMSHVMCHMSYVTYHMSQI